MSQSPFSPLDPVGRIALRMCSGTQFSSRASLACRAVAQVGVTAAVADVPLAGGNDLQRSLRPSRRTSPAWVMGRRFAYELARLAKQSPPHGCWAPLRWCARRSRRTPPGRRRSSDASTAGRKPAGRLAPRWLSPAGSSSRHQVTSVVSPKVQIMADAGALGPGSASSWASYGHLGGLEQRDVVIV